MPAIQRAKSGGARKIGRNGVRCAQYKLEIVILQTYVGQHQGTPNAWFVHTASGTEGDCYVNEQCLSKPYDGIELCEWSDVIWQPKELVVVS